MVPAPFIVVLDANVLFPFTLRDTLLRAAAADFYQLRWSSAILDEMSRNLISSGTMAADKAARLRATMESVFPDADVTGYEDLVSAMKTRRRTATSLRLRSAGQLRADIELVQSSPHNTQQCREERKEEHRS